VNSALGNRAPVRIATVYGSQRSDRSTIAIPTRSPFSSDSVPHRNQSASMAEGLHCEFVIRWTSHSVCTALPFSSADRSTFKSTGLMQSMQDISGKGDHP
jgi:hypothetical protein